MRVMNIVDAVGRARDEVWFFWQTRKPLDRSLWTLDSLDVADGELLRSRVCSDVDMRMIAEMDLEALPRPQRKLYVRTLIRYMSTPGAPQGEQSCRRALQRAAPELWAAHGAVAAAMDEHRDERLEVAMAEFERRWARAQRARHAYRLE